VTFAARPVEELPQQTAHGLPPTGRLLRARQIEPSTTTVRLTIIAIAMMTTVHDSRYPGASIFNQHGGPEKKRGNATKAENHGWGEGFTNQKGDPPAA